MVNLQTRYLGLELKNPLVPSASPLSEKVDTIKRLEDAGASAVVMFSIFEEQIRQEASLLESRLTAGSESFAEALSYFPAVTAYRVQPDRYLETIAKAAESVQIPIIGSLNGVSHEGWIEYARKIQQAGAKALELNIYFIPTDPSWSGSRVEQMYLDLVRAIKSTVTIPVAVKLGPYFSALANMAHRLENAGADGLVLFNRFYQPDFNLDSLAVEPSLSLSRPEEIRLALRWIAILYGQVKCSLAATTGVHSVKEIVKYLLAGADVVQMASVLLQNGPDYLKVLLKDLENWLETKDYKSVDEIRGLLSQKNVADPMAFERANYIKILEKYKGEYQWET